MAGPAPVSSAPVRRRRSARRGAMALLTGIVFAVLFTLFLSVAMSYHQNGQRQTRTTKYHTQAQNIAQAGLTDASNWFRRQRVQPVTAFDPLASELDGAGQNQDPWRLDPGGSGSGLEHLGIVKEMEFDGEANLWARYEVGKITHFTEDTSGNHVYSVLEESAPGVWEKRPLEDADSTAWEGVQDVSANYGIDVPGTIWRVRSHGYIYRRDPKANPDTPFYQAPHQVLGQAELEIELNRLGVPLLQAAVLGGDGQFIRFGHPPYNDDNLDNIRIIANDGYMARHSKGNPKPPAPKPPFNGAKIDYLEDNNLDLSPAAVFGVPDLQALAALADKVYTSVAELPAQLPAMGFIYLKPGAGGATFTAARPLTGSGIVVCEGDLTIARGSDSNFAGFLYIVGNYEQNSRSTVKGSICIWDPDGGKGYSSTVVGDEQFTTIEYDPAALEDIQKRIGYRERKVPLRRLE